MVIDETKSRLLEAAGEEFAEKGFEKATVRAICDRAQVKNLAAVNYYFGSKESLYEAALLAAHECGADLLEFPDGQGTTPEEQLRQYVRAFLAMILGQSARGQGWRHRLMVREITEPTAAIDTLVRQTIRPRFQYLMTILRKILPGEDERRVDATAFSIIGQCLHYKFAKQVNVRLLGEDAYARLDLDFVSDHIARFCLAALGLGAPLGATVEPRVPSRTELN